MRVLMVHPGPHYSVADVYNGWTRGLGQAGVGVADFNLDNRLDFYSAAHVGLANGDMPKAFDPETAMHMAINGIYSSAFLWWPDVVIMVMGTFVTPTVVERLRDRGMHMVLLCTESPYEDERHLKQAEAFDTVIVNDPVNIDAFHAVNRRTYYIGHAFDPITHYPGSQSRSGVTFVGTGFPSRIELLEDVDWSGLDLRLGGNWQFLPIDSPLNKYLLDDPDACMENTDTADCYRSSVAGFNCYRQEHHDGAHAHADGVACGPREIEMAACGLPFVRDPRPESDELFPFLPTYDTAGELERQLRWLVSDPSRAAELGRRARVAVARRTFAHNAAQLLRIIDKA